MASKVLVPAPPFTKLQVKKSPQEQSGSGYIISGADAVARVAHLEHSVRFLQEQHRLMLSGLHAEIEALRERNRDLQFQLIFNKESAPKTNLPAADDVAEVNEDAQLKREVVRLEREAAGARGEARAAEARALQLQRLVDAQAEKLRELELSPAGAGGDPAGAGEETRGELRLRLADAERLVRRLRGDAERQRREVLARGGPAAAAGVTNLLFDGAHARHAHLQCMKNSLQASLRGAGLEAGYYARAYQLPHLHAPEFWRDALREEYPGGGAVRGAHAAGAHAHAHAAAAGAGCARRPLTLPELAGQQIPRPTGYANHHTRPRANGYENRNRRGQATNGEAVAKSPDEHTECPRLQNLQAASTDIAGHSRVGEHPELKVVFARIIPHGNVSNGPGMQCSPGAPGAEAPGGCRAGARPRRHHHRKPAADHT